MKGSYVFLYFLLGIFLVKGSKLEMPSYAVSGEKVTLACKLDHEKYNIEHVKWYKNNELFYVASVTPANETQATKVELQGVHIDLNESKMDKIILNSVGEESSGLYTCELKTEHDLARMSGTLTVRSLKE